MIFTTARSRHAQGVVRIDAQVILSTKGIVQGKQGRWWCRRLGLGSGLFITTLAQFFSVPTQHRRCRRIQGFEATIVFVAPAAATGRSATRRSWRGFQIGRTGVVVVVVGFFRPHGIRSRQIFARRCPFGIGTGRPPFRFWMTGIATTSIFFIVVAVVVVTMFVLQISNGKGLGARRSSSGTWLGGASTILQLWEVPIMGVRFRSRWHPLAIDRGCLGASKGLHSFLLVRVGTAFGWLVPSGIVRHGRWIRGSTSSHGLFTTSRRIGHAIGTFGTPWFGGPPLGIGAFRFVTAGDSSSSSLWFS